MPRAGLGDKGGSSKYGLSEDKDFQAFDEDFKKLRLEREELVEETNGLRADMRSLIGDERKGERRHKPQDVSFLQYTTASSPARGGEDESLMDDSRSRQTRGTLVQDVSSWSAGRDEVDKKREVLLVANRGWKGEEHGREEADPVPSERQPSRVKPTRRAATPDEGQEEGETLRSDLESKFRVLCRKQASLQEQAITVEAREKSLKTREEKYAKLLEEFGEQRTRWRGLNSNRVLVILPQAQVDPGSCLRPRCQARGRGGKAEAKGAGGLGCDRRRS